MKALQQHRVGFWLLFILAGLWYITGSQVQGQVRSGISFLKILPGARPQGMGNTYTGMTDDLNALLANPGSAGFLRSWQWTVNYTRWIADVYRASVLYGRTVRIPGLQKTSFSVGFIFQGMAEFNSLDQPTAATDASDQLLLLNLAQPLYFLSEHLALGINAKYLRSQLDRYQATSWVFDTGLFFKSGRFALPRSVQKLFPIGYVTAGMALNQLGQPVRFIREGTPLPRTFRMGVHFHAGSHGGLQMQVGIDYQNIRDDGEQVNLGGELSWRNLLTLRAGYFLKQPGDHLLNRFNFGFSFGIDDVRGRLLDLLPGRNKAMRLDFGALNSQDLFAGTYRGSLSHLPIGPAAFTFLEPEPGRLFEADSVVLRWSPSEDPDPYDDLLYWLLVDSSRSRIETILSTLDARARLSDRTVLPGAGRLLLAEIVNQTGYRLKALQNGDYYWAVLAVDLDGHVQAAEKDGQRIAHFRINFPDVQITSIQFIPYDRITTDDYQGKIKVSVVNAGHQTLKQVELVVLDSTQALISEKNGHTSSAPDAPVLHKTTIPRLNPGDTLVVEFDWRTSIGGLHDIVAVVDAPNRIAESREDNNTLVRSFYTIPKGTISSEDTSTAMIFSHVTYDLPFIAEVNFDSGDTRVKEEYVRGDLLPAPLTILAERLAQHRNLRISIQGVADPNSGETEIDLADARARAVRDTLIRLGVLPEQIQLLPGRVLPRRRVPRNPEDAKWVFEERRYARIYADREAESTLFQPMKFTDVEPLSVPVTFLVDINGVQPLKKRLLILSDSALTDTLDLKAFDKSGKLFGIIGWRYPIPENFQEKDWTDHSIRYRVILIDSLGRTFRSEEQSIYLTSNSVLRDEKYAWPLKFAQTDPLYDFYWNRLFSHVARMLKDRGMRMRFVGHACAIGPEQVNQRLSVRRAERFQNRFLEYVKANYPESYQTILERLDPPIGRGENEPLNIQHTSGRIIVLGKNNSPLGRKLNRRIEIDFYSPEKPLQEAMEIQ